MVAVEMSVVDRVGMGARPPTKLLAHDVPFRIHVLAAATERAIEARYSISHAKTAGTQRVSVQEQDRPRSAYLQPFVSALPRHSNVRPAQPQRHPIKACLAETQ
jgi:hypothetical protein